ncbi:transglutaminase-like domain-containing protein [Roseiterribacter gracilis]|uniref:Transglutaminase n=1 Tax=Roseiterribacter gracilis TaxID=2812848 RepID=A0A8S8X8B8_9PROT|nr:transglutaminase [Rhodospirillales bacterium TMPK1]
MRIRTGYNITYECSEPTAILAHLDLHPSRARDLETPDRMITTPGVELHRYEDMFGNICTRLLAPAGRITLKSEFILRDSGATDPVAPGAIQHPVAYLPDEALTFLLGSRYCETDRLSDIAWTFFGQTEPGWARVEAIVNFVHDHIRFDYQQARPTRGAYEAYIEQIGVCRDYAHLAIAFCRCMNIPARYCTGYLGDIGVPLKPPMDFSAWFEAYLGGRWYVFDARNKIPRIGRALIARGRDATDVAITTSFGRLDLISFDVVATELPELQPAEPA